MAVAVRRVRPTLKSSSSIKTPVNDLALERVYLRVIAPLKEREIPLHFSKKRCQVNARMGARRMSGHVAIQEEMRLPSGQVPNPYHGYCNLSPRFQMAIMQDRCGVKLHDMFVTWEGNPMLPRECTLHTEPQPALQHRYQS